MKELNKKPNLTSEPQTPYSRSRYGDKFMDEKSEMPPRKEQSSGQQQTEKSAGISKPISSERQHTQQEIVDMMEKMKNVDVGVKRAWQQLRSEDPSFGWHLSSEKGKPLSAEELSRSLNTGDPAQIGESLLKLQGSAGSKDVPEQEAVKGRREEAPQGIKFEAYNLNIAGINDQRIISMLNSLEVYRGLPFQIAQDPIKEAFANIVALPNANPAEIQLAKRSIANFIAEIGGRGEITDEQYREIIALPLDEKINTIKGELSAVSPQNEYYSRRLIDLTFGEGLRDTFDYMVNKIISLPLSQETASYQLGLTSQMNLEVITSVLADAINSAENTDDRKRLEDLARRLSDSQESFKLLHEMNKLVRAGQLDQFLQYAGNVTPEHLNYLQGLPAVSAAMRAFEQTYDEFLTRRGWVYSEESAELSEKVYSALEEFNRGGVFGKPLEVWELRRAHAIAGKMYNITLRSAEKIATGTVPREELRKERIEEFEKAEREGRHADAQRIRKEIAEAEILSKHRYSSFPFESMGRIMNPIQLLIWRFEVGKDESGSSMEFLKLVKKYYREFLTSGKDPAKLKINKITRLGGVSVEEMEYGGIFGVSGLYSSWRQENMFISQMRVDGETTVQQWIANHAPEIDIAKATKDPARVAEVLRPLIENVKAGRGILLRQGPFTGKVGYEARKLLWEKIAEENVSLMTNYLSGIKFESGAQDIPPSFNEIVSNVGGDVNIDQFKQKVMLEQEIKMRQAARQLHPELFSGQGADRIELPEFSAEEFRLKEALVDAGKNLAPHLADIAFPYTPFLNDTFFEVFDYSFAGHEFYRRRLAGDFPSYNKAAGAFAGIVDNPGANPEEIIKHLHEIERGIESPNGRPDGQRRTFPMAEAWLEWIMTKPWKRHVVYKAIEKSMLQATSKAQEHSGIDAPSIDETQARALIEHLVNQAILDEDLADELKKKKNLKFVGLLWAFFRDMFTAVIPGVAVYSFGKEVLRTK